MFSLVSNKIYFYGLNTFLALGTDFFDELASDVTAAVAEEPDQGLR